MIYSVMSYLFYFIALIAGYAAAYEILLQMFPDYGLIHIVVGGTISLMFFPLIPLYPGIMSGEWTLAILCYIAIFFGVIFGNQARQSKTN